MPKLLAMSALLTSVAVFLSAPHAAFAQTCNPALQAGFLATCPPVTRHLDVYRGGYDRYRRDNGFHDDHGFHGNGGSNDFNHGNGRAGGMGQGGGAHGR
jgi:hypothetical protein